MNTKFVLGSYAVIATSVVASILYTKKLERETVKFAKKMEQDRIELQESIARLAK